MEEPKENVNMLKGSRRSVVVGSDHGASFSVGFDHGKQGRVPNRLLKYEKKEITADEIEQKQMQAAERRRQTNNYKSSQARKVSEDVVNIDKKVQSMLQNQSQQQQHQRRWFEHLVTK